MKILVCSPAWVGDAVMAQPLYRRLHERHPGLELHVLAPAWTLPVLARMPEVARSHLNPFGHGALKLIDRLRLGRKLAREHFDQVIVLQNSLKSALVPFATAAKLRTGYIGEMRYGLLNDLRELDEKALPDMVGRFVALGEDRGQLPQRPIPHPRLRTDPASQAATVARLGLDAGTPVVAFCPGAEYGPAKRWPARHFAALAQQCRDAGMQVWIFGSGKDQDIAGEIVRLAGENSVVNLCGVTQLDEAIDLLSLAQVAICNDSGLMHIAAALDLPLVAIYGSSSPDFTPPLSEHAEIVTLSLDCSPCFERVCPLGHMDCLNKLGADMVWSALDQAIARKTNDFARPGR
ncbi:MAG: lipopolysaccharide heptosyltransferase II [Microvirgula sp.]